MPRGLNRSGDFRNGTPIALPHNFGNPVTLPHEFGNPVTHGNDPTQFGNPVTWPTPDPAHFGNSIGPSQQATPTFSPVGGTYTSIQTVTITSVGADTIYYTTDGSTPTTGSTVYSGPISVAVSETVKALAVKAGLTNSAIGTAAYTINIPVVAPTFVQDKMAFDGSGVGVTTTVALTAPATTGNSVLAFITVQANHTVIGVVDDTLLNTYTLVRGPDNVTGGGGPANTYVYACLAVAGTPQTLTITVSNPINQNPVMSCVVETTPAAVDANISNNAAFNTGADIDGGAIVTNVATDLLLLFAFYANGGGNRAYSAGTGWTLVDQLADLSFIGERLGFETQTAGVAGSYEAFVQVAVANAGNGIITSLALKGA